MKLSSKIISAGTIAAAALLMTSPFISPSAQAEDGDMQTPQYKISDTSTEGLSDLAKKIKIAAQIHDARPVRVIIEDIARNVALGTTESKREQVYQALLKEIDYQKVRETSIKRMADIFTAEELEVMRDFYSSEAYKTILEKEKLYVQLMQPVIFKEIDGALMKIRTGE